MREYVATAKTVEEAIQLGCEALSVDRDDLGVSYEILEMPQKTGFLGLKVTPAKVKVTVETADTEPETTPAAPVAAAEPEPPAEEAPNNPRQRMLPRRKLRPRWILPLTPACRLRWIT